MNGANSNFPPAPQDQPAVPPRPHYPPAVRPVRPPVQPPAARFGPPAVRPVNVPQQPLPLPPRPAAIVPARGFRLPPAGRGRRWEVSGLVELIMAFPWLWWSWLSIQLIGTPSTTVYVIAMVAWGAFAVSSLHPQVEDFLAWKVWRLRTPNGLESHRLGPAWHNVCTAAGIDPNRYRVWIHEGPQVTAPPVAGSTIAVTSWSTLTLPDRLLEAVLAHELAHRLALPRLVSLVVYCLQLPARMMGKALRVAWKTPVVSILLKAFLVIYALGIIGIWAWWGFDYVIVFLLSPILAPFVVPAAARASEMYADRIAFDLGYGPALVQVFTGREFQRAQAWTTAPPQGLKDSQPLDSARLRALERLISSSPQNGHQPPY